MKKKTLFDKVWDSHVVSTIPNGPQILYIDTHLIHEVTSPQAFAELEDRNISIFRPNQIVATADHNVPTFNQHLPIKDELSKQQVEQLTKNCKKNNITLYGLGHQYQGIVHVIAPELGITLPGMTMVCGDSHTSTHGAFGTIAFGIGTSQVAQVFASQCLLLNKPKSLRITVNGILAKNVTPKDVILYIISKIGTNAGTGYFCEYAGSVFREMSMEGRMTVCNMSIEMGARGGMIAPDATTFEYIQGRKFAPKGNELKEKIDYWKTLVTDEEAVFDKEYHFDAQDIAPMITYGTNPGMGIKITETVPFINNDPSFDKAIEYMGFSKGEYLLNKIINYVFIGSCTNSRIEDFRAVAHYIKGKQKASNVYALIVPGSQQVAIQIKEEGLSKIFEEAGFQIRQPGCSACLAMNEDKIPAGEYCVSTSNRNFEGRQGQGARTLLTSPVLAAAIAIEGKIVMAQI
ncbi:MULTISPECIES: 3-isopropylmalate dehydratase large subunit [Flavobacterium]|uniref:3-isopropylmalate dehydratase n=1 Tax=Flavobacterium covae TaxID=2906076 RepID=A0ABW8PEF0_9FLAO|nr:MULTISPECIES: 3-isopropylmalate dehydratase large subunit [Flavobacterium]OXA79403.1 3-isopropylmalate dehydratase large subunit [Flavobacterium columnare NBRC 100251 = ATCC 23463]AMA49691.1 isopropylmalate isomerase [Flavobacterium covae]MCJ1805828.1 3-isopropylmalate dehydratase large subunit [Flavobacterium covae]MCJ1810154.1 3-isopropylmalate dehydratase large subunit [Flavobacterium covae]OWP81999.1 3-isopropylmalate dehydratase large subunit [Flavobacterium covae]